MVKKQLIYVRNGNEVDMYTLTIDSKLKKTQGKIDEWYGKGKLRTDIGTLSMPSNPFDRMEIISQKLFRNGISVCSCCAHIDTVDFYQYNYYQYKPHALSLLCDRILENCDSIEFSNDIRTLLDWQPKSEEESILLKEILESIHFEKVKGKVPEVSCIRRVIEFLKETKSQIKLNRYDDALDKKIESMQNINSGFYARELHSKEFKYNPDERARVMEKIKSSLPTISQLENIA